MTTSATARNSCPTCHGLEYVSQPTSTVASVSRPSTWSAFDTQAGSNVGSRKGPHGGYTSGTQKCETCHVIHNAPGNLALLPENTIDATCNTCHDGTGGGGVYGVIQFRTGVAPTGQHRIGAARLNGNGKVTVPAGDPATGGSIETTFTGENGSLTCTDCHSPHDTNTVKPFVGDRVRTAGDVTRAIPTDRLLRQIPTKGTAAVSEYGSNWCEACHKGAHPTGAVFTHSVSRDADGYWYNRVIRRAGYDTTASSLVATDLGGSNLGYVESTATPRPKPICQQCHEDVRTVGDTQKFTVDSLTESFTVNADGVGGGNPRFQNFPHETGGVVASPTAGAHLLIEQDPDLCHNCH